MQAFSTSYHQVTGTGWLTTTSLVLIVLFAAVTLVAIFYGMRLASQRRAASRIEQERIEAETATPEPPIQAPLAPAPLEPPREPEPAPVAVAPREAAPPEIPAAPPAAPIAGTPAADPLPAAPDITDEPVAAAAPLDASPASEAESAPPPPTPSAPAPRTPDVRPLTTLKGLGPKVASRLNELGIQTVGDLAALDAAQAEAIDARLGPFTGRMARDRWLEQARLLDAGDDAGFEAVFGRL